MNWPFIVIFKIYDVGEDGVLDADELFQVLKMIVGSNLDNEKLRQIVRQTIEEVSSSSDEDDGHVAAVGSASLAGGPVLTTQKTISYEDFARTLSDQDVHSQMSIKFWRVGFAILVIST